MGYGSYTNSAGRQCGYAVDATCDHEGCEAEIHRGVSYLCGDGALGDWGCGAFVCDPHLHTVYGPDDEHTQLCPACVADFVRPCPACAGEGDDGEAECVPCCGFGEVLIDPNMPSEPHPQEPTP